VEFDDLSNRVIGCAIEVHRALGPGLLESAYGRCLGHELSLAEIPFAREESLPVRYKGTQIDCGYRVDLIVAERLIVELKTVDRLLPIHEAQVLTYLRLSGIKVGLLINFNVEVLKDGLKRLVL
jgi:GxxExxY protein